jgi:GGDEF domain-containing protein
MDNINELFFDLFFKNNGEIDLLTGTIAPNQFNQIVRRDSQLSDRSNSKLSIICLNINISKFSTLYPSEDIKLALENALIAANFELTKIFRNSDCICRISQLGFWVLVTEVNSDISKKLLKRVAEVLPDYFDIEISHRTKGQSQLDWYSQIDELHFRSN